jgi:hypothetical protein
MVYRSDCDAALDRIDALEDELRRSERERKRLGAALEKAANGQPSAVVAERDDLRAELDHLRRTSGAPLDVERLLARFEVGAAARKEPGAGLVLLVFGPIALLGAEVSRLATTLLGVIGVLGVLIALFFVAAAAITHKAATRPERIRDIAAALRGSPTRITELVQKREIIHIATPTSRLSFPTDDDDELFYDLRRRCPHTKRQ